MKQLILFILIIASFSSCTEEDVFLKNKDLIGKWKLIEQYSDPGDGSGDFQPIESKRIIEFFKNGKIISNGSFCAMNSDTGEHGVGVFNDKTEAILVKNECNSSEYKINYKLIDGNLQLWYPCIEGCAQKFEKVSS